MGNDKDITSLNVQKKLDEMSPEELEELAEVFGGRGCTGCNGIYDPPSQAGSHDEA